MAAVTSPVTACGDLKGVSLGKLFDTQFPTREYVLEPWFRTGESCLIWAGSGVGKTMLTLSLALAIAGGGKVWEWTAPKPRKVLIVDGEMNLMDLQDRLRMLLGNGAVDRVDRAAAGRNLEVIARQAQDPESEFFDITLQDHQLALLERCRKDKVEVLIIDNLSTVADGLADENDSTAFRTVQTFLLRMKAAGITTILVHHARKDGQEPRGSTALNTTFEVILGLKKPAVSTPGKASFVAAFSKFRAKGDGTIAPKTWSLEDTGWKVEDDQEDSLVQTLKAFQSLNFVSQQEVADALGVNKGTVSRRAQLIVARGLATEDGLKGYLGEARGLRDRQAAGHSLDLDDTGPDDNSDF
ncbi:AAA family ATPase [Devosia sp. SL43]|uniref:AAA family ATPase n=1 Tax=Devosia sp. SL43 TaxID=2806348 RepID=UPI001F19969E|nr:AAA family ATPase [Devosia sp. SL43]UJW85101.1 AAA family ATPase [Devosia sp. SL43]